MVIINNEFIKIYDSIILNEIENNFNIDKLSSKLRCSKSIIVDRIDELIERGYITIQNDSFALTEAGYNKRLSSDIYSYDKKVSDELSSKQAYNWEKIYIPSENIFD